MSDPLQKALAAFRTRHSELGELAVSLRTAPLLARIERLPRIPRRRDDDVPVVQPTLSPHEIAQQWSSGGVGWLRGLRRRDLSAVVAATADPSVGPFLASEQSFVGALFPLLRPRQQRRAASNLVFQRYPPSSALTRAVHELRGEDPERSPAWWERIYHPEELAKSLGEAIAVDGWHDAREAWQIPDVAWASQWADKIVTTVVVRSVDELERLLRFVDGGVEKGSPAPLLKAHHPVIRGLVAFGERKVAFRLRIAALLRRRVGDVFGVLDEARWRGLEAERRKIRSWVASEILDILFKNLVPDTMGAHQTEPRRHFWRKYTGRVDRLWLLVDSNLQRRLGRTEVRDLLEKVGDLVEVRELRGQVQQAIVWMHLRPDRGGVVTVIEGNANTTCRVRPGAHEPPRRGTVDYSHDIVHGVHAVGSGAHDQAHLGSWEDRLGTVLANLGIRP